MGNYNTLYCTWVTPYNLANQIKKLQDTGAFIQSVVIVESNTGVTKYEVSYTDITKDN